MHEQTAEEEHEESQRLKALTLAVAHHGLSCFARGAVPARAETVLLTADLFLDYLNNEAPTYRR